MKLTILETSDIHANIYPTNYFDEHEQPYGLLKVASAIKKEIDQIEGEYLLIENGDFIQGTPLGHYVSRYADEPDQLVEGLNAIGYDAGTLGNHEFNFGKSYVESAMNALNFPILSANILDENGESFGDKPYTIIEKGNLKIAVLGLTTQYIPHWEIEPNIKGLTFSSAVEKAKKWAPKLKEIADILVVTYHGGFERDMESGKVTENQTGENEGYQLIDEVPEIDVLLTGHQHRKIATHINGKPVIQPGYRGEFVGKIVLDIDDTTKEITHSEPALLPTKDYPLNEKVKDIYDPLEKDLGNWLNKIIGHTGEKMAINDTMEARMYEHPYIEFVNRMQLDISGADISSTSLFTDTQPGFPKEIRVIDVMVNYGYPNVLVVIEVTGEELKSAMEQSSAFFKISDQGDIMPSYYEKNVKPQPYLYDMYEGIDYVIDISQPVGERIVTLDFKGQAVKANDTFKLVTNQYRANGGGNYEMFYEKPFIDEWETPISEQMIEYIASKEYIKTDVNHNFKVIASKLEEDI